MMRSDQTFRDIRGAGGPETTSDCYVREPGSDTWYFIGKVARVSGKRINNETNRPSASTLSNIANETKTNQISPLNFVWLLNGI